MHSVLGLAGIFIYAKTEHCREYLLDRLNAAIAGNITVENHEISFIQGRVVFENVTVSGSTGEQLAALPNMTAEIDYLPLLRGLVIVQTLNLD